MLIEAEARRYLKRKVSNSIGTGTKKNRKT
jgi:hypothetical protein